MARHDQSGGESTPGIGLADAAAAMEAELRHFEDLSAAARRAPLDSQKSIAHATGAARDAADSQKRFGERLAALAAAIQVARQRQESAAEALNVRIDEIDARAVVFTDLQTRFAALGEEARGLNTLMQSVAPSVTGAGRESMDGSDSPLEAVRTGLSNLLDRARTLQEAAREVGLKDLAAQADALRQQVLSARNKVELLQPRTLTN